MRAASLAICLIALPGAAAAQTRSGAAEQARPQNPVEQSRPDSVMETLAIIVKEAAEESQEDRRAILQGAQEAEGRATSPDNATADGPNNQQAQPACVSNCPPNS